VALVLLCGQSLWVHTASAQTTWTAGAPAAQRGDWSNAANWSSGVPGAGNTAIFNSSAAITAGLPASIAVLQINNAATSVSLAGGVVFSLTASSGSALQIASGATFDTGPRTIYISGASATVDVSGALQLGPTAASLAFTGATQQLNIASGGSLVLDAGAVSLGTAAINYATGSNLEFFGNGNRTVGQELPATMPGNIIVTKLSNVISLQNGITTTVSGTYTHVGAGRLIVQNPNTRLIINGATSISAGQVAVNGTASSLALNGATSISVANGLSIAAGVARLNAGASTGGANSIVCGSGTILELGGPVSGGSTDVSYVANTLLRYINTASILAGAEWPDAPAANNHPIEIACAAAAHVRLGGTKIAAGTFTLTSGVLNVQTYGLSLGGPSNPSANFNGGVLSGTANSTSSGLTLSGTGLIAGVLSMDVSPNNQLGVLSINRMGQTLTIGGTNPLVVNNNLALNAGFINNTPPIILASGVGFTGASNSSYVMGPVRQTINTTGLYVYPLGGSGNYRPIRVNKMNGTGDLEVAFNLGGGGTSTDIDLAGNNRRTRIEVMSGSLGGGFVELQQVGAISPQSGFAFAPTQTGTYSNLGIGRFVQRSVLETPLPFLENVSAPSITSQQVPNLSTIGPWWVFGNALNSLVCYGSQPGINITAASPVNNAIVPRSAFTITNTFSHNVTVATASVNNYFQYGSFTGRKLMGTGSVASNVATFGPTTSFFPAEPIFSICTNAQTSVGVRLCRGGSGRYIANVGGTGRGNFVQAGTTNVLAPGTNGSSVVLDINGDGNLDVAVIDQGTGTYTFRLGTGMGTFGGGGSFTPSANGQFFDMDGDGDLDFVCANAGAFQVLVYKYSAGSFGAPLTTAVNNGGLTSPVMGGNVVLADFDQDGDFDIACGVAGAGPQGTVVVLLNNGNATDFTNQVVAPILSDNIIFPSQARDVDNDGIFDLICTAGTSARVMRNNGSAGFIALGMPFAISNASASLNAEDMDGNQTADVVTSYNGTIQVLSNNGSGAYNLAATLNASGVIGSLTAGNVVQLMDVDADNDLDIVGVGYNTGTLGVCINNGGNSFRLQSITIGGSPRTASRGDFDNDGDVDIVSYNETTGQLVFLRNDPPAPVLTSVGPTPNTNTASLAGTASFTFNQPMSAVTASPSTVRFFGSMTGALNGSLSQPSATQVTFQPATQPRPNEHIWVTVTNAQSSAGVSTTRATVFGFRMASGAGPGTLILASTASVGMKPRGVVVADFNRDGFIDAATVNRNSDNVTVLQNGGAAQMNVVATLGVDTAPQAIAVADVNGDRLPDILTANSGSAGKYSLSVLRNNGGFTFAPAVTVQAASGNLAPDGIWTGDLDGDGDLDVAVCSSASTNITIFTNNGSGTFTASATLSAGLYAPRAITGGDMDGDGDLDLVTIGAGGPVAIWVNMFANATPAPTWPFVFTSFSGGPPAAHSLECVDLNGDGTLDVMAASTSQFATAANNGRGILSAFTTQMLGTPLDRIRTADMNGDGTLDYVSVSQSQNLAAVTPSSGTATATPLGMGVGPLDVAAADLDNDGDVDVVTANDNGNSLSVLLNQPPPALTLTPTSLDFGSANVGAPVQQTLMLSGSNLVSNVTLRASMLTPLGAPATVTLSTSLNGTYSTTLTVSAAAVTAGLTVHVRFTAPTSATLTGLVTASATAAAGQTVSWQGIGLVAAPQISSVLPLMPLSGNAVVIQGQNFNSVQSVTLAGIALSVVNSTPTQITVTAPASGMGTITVTTLSGSTTSTQIVSVVPRPAITGFAPASGTTGTVVNISGVALNSMPQVQFGGIPSPMVTVQSSTNIVAVVPMGAVTGPITVTTGLGSTTSTASFVISQPPSIVSVSPVLVGAGTLITITGNNFAGVNSVRIAGVAAAGFTVSAPNPAPAMMPNTITAIVPPNATSGSVIVTNPSGSDTSDVSLTFVPPPVIAGVSPTSGGSITTVTVTGANLSAVTKLSVGGVAVGFTVVNDSTLTFTGAIASGVIMVTSVGGTASSKQAFTSIPPPSIVSFTPAQGSTGSTVIITGINFLNIDSVSFGGVRGVISSSNATQVVVVVGTGASGLVQVFTRQGVASSVGQFAFVQKMGEPPFITGISPTSAYQGDSVVIFGQNLNGATQVRFGDSLAASYRVVSNTRIVAVLAGGSTGTVVVTTPAGIAASFFTFRHLGPPPPPMVVTALQRDMSALERVYRFTQGDDWLNKEFWITTASVSRWHGVTVDSAGGELRVTRLELANNNLQGEIPTALGELTALQVLDVSGNKLTGAIPAVLANCKNLQHLNLSNNQLTEGVPDALAGLGKLQVLAVASAGLQGAFPTAFCTTASLRDIDLSGNALTGTVPECLTKLPALMSLNLSNNQLSGVLPAYLGSFPVLTALRLARNRFMGAVPAEIGVTTLAAQNRKYNGGEISGLKTLQVLDVSGNALTGGIPTTLWNIPTLKDVRLSSNALTGALPVEASRVVGLQTLDVSGNRLTGAVPAEFGLLDSLRTLALDSNQLTGELPSAIQGLRQIRTLGLAWNRFTRLPSLVNLSFLTLLRLEGNALSFESIETQIARGRTVTYSPQDSTGRGFDTVATVGAQFKLTATGGGTSGRYQWFRRTSASNNISGNVDTLTKQTAVTLQLDNVSASDAGQYWCRITNAAARDLTLWTRSVTLRSELPPPPTQVPTLLAPNDGASSVPLNVSLRWAAVSDAMSGMGVAANVTGYEVQISVDNFQTLVTSATVLVPVSASAVTSLQWQARGLDYTIAYRWRVRAVNAGGAGPWSAVRGFSTLTRGEAVGVATMDFGRVTLKSTTQASLVLTNQTAQNLTIQSASVSEQGGINFRLLLPSVGGQAVVGQTLLPAQTLTLPVEFAPVSTGQKVGTLKVVYRTDSGVRDSSTIAGAVVGSGGALEVRGANFGVVNVGRPAGKALQVLNNSSQPTRIQNVRFVSNPNAVFSLSNLADLLGLTLKGDSTVTIPLVVTAQDTGTFAATLRVESSLDVVDIALVASAIKPRPQDVSMTIAAVPNRTNVPPGDTVSISMVFKVDSLGAIDIIRRAVPSFGFQAELQFNTDVLVLEPLQPAYQLNGTSSTTAQIVVNTGWDGKITTTVIKSLQCRVLNSSTDATLLLVRSFAWNPSSSPTTSDAVITVQTGTVTTGTVTSTFRAALCEAGGKRFVRQSTTGTLVVRSAATPQSQDAVFITYALRETGIMTLTLYDAAGRKVADVAGGLHEAGMYEMPFDTRALLNGAYTLVLTTPTVMRSERFVVVR
jgi:Leucine-rich repeat (LRR) protein